MNIAIFGYGKMGKEIEAIAIKRSHTVGLKIGSQTKLDDLDFSNIDVAIEFSKPETAVKNIRYCFQKNIPVVIGTTGWYNHFEEIEMICNTSNQAMLHATNFSVGVNLFFKLNEYLAKIMDHYENYTPKMKEIHHTQKLDAPSGTAITLAEGILNKVERKSEWVNQISTDNKQLEIISERIENVPGTHLVNYTSEIDDIEIKHTAHNRKGFALGAVIAAEWIQGKKGTFTMNDVLNVNLS